MDVVKLVEFRRKHGLSLAQMAHRLNDQPGLAKVSVSTVDRWERDTIPRQENMRRLQAATSGAVTFADFYDDTPKPPRRRRSMAINCAASRKGRATLRRQREARA
jgi:transcriptional regulator with XRE-family HTH domain